jgi:GMP synthase-like glutamine amidotransferase
MTNLVKAYMNTKDLKILGLCFGHQAIAKYMGGNVIKIPKRIIGL